MRYLSVFDDFENVKSFFTYKQEAYNGSTFKNFSFIESVGLGKVTIVWPKQVHKDEIAIIDEVENSSWIYGFESEHKTVLIPETDGLITNRKGILLTTVHADCLPVYFYDYVNKAIGLVHAGWRGTNLGIAPKCFREMHEAYGTKPKDVKVFIGPGICEKCFEVGEEVFHEFASNWPFIEKFAISKRNSKYKDEIPADIDNADDVSAEDKYYIDLKGINKRQLLETGITPENVEVTSHCTFHESELFCSYRREGGTYMRMGAGICLL